MSPALGARQKVVQSRGWESPDGSQRPLLDELSGPLIPFAYEVSSRSKPLPAAAVSAIARAWARAGATVVARVLSGASHAGQGSLRWR
jgi:hypothetical protein